MLSIYRYNGIYINSRYYNNYSTKTSIQLLDPVWYIEIGVSHKRDNYYIIYNTESFDDPETTAYEMDISQLKEFLLIIYYNQLILIL